VTLIVAAMSLVFCSCSTVLVGSAAEWTWFRERGEGEESGVEGLRRDLKSMADEERCIQAKAWAFQGGDSASLIVGDLSTTRWGRAENQCQERRRR
jgi:hypothetical protein